MMTTADRFSRRHGFGEFQPAEITTRLEAPPELRGVVLDLAYECKMLPSKLREIICRVVRKRPDSDNWSERPNIAAENEQLIDGCPWYEVYDIIEAVLVHLRDSGMPMDAGIVAAVYFEHEINRYFFREGIGWKVADCIVQYRGSEPFEDAVKGAAAELSFKGMSTSAGEIRQARTDLSRRPDPDVTGAVQHALAALECLAREVAGDPRVTMGELIARHPGLFPKAVGEICSKAWGYASEFGRHLREGRAPDPGEVELVVHLSAVLCSYLSKKLPERSADERFDSK
jgi:hypothetical protein